MKITLPQLRKIIRESIEEVMLEDAFRDLHGRHADPQELADLLGWDWYSLTPAEKRDMGDLMRGVLMNFDDEELEAMIHQLPLEKNFVATKPGKIGTPGKIKVDTKSMVDTIKKNFMN